MPASGRPWERERSSFRDECKAAKLPCWLCNKPINYWAKAKSPDSFTADHVTPTSLGGDALRRANLKPAHYQRMQQQPR
jgi:hypothetical protein